MSLKMLAAAVISCALLGCGRLDRVGPSSEVSDASLRAEAARVLRSSPAHRQPIPVFIDGRRYVPPAEPGEFSIIDPDRIATAQLLTGPAGEAKADAAGRRGVIWITTKEAAAH